MPHRGGGMEKRWHRLVWVSISWGWMTVTVGAVSALLAGCSPAPPSGEQPSTPAASQCTVTRGTELAPASGILSGVNLDWEQETLQEYSDGLGRRPAVVVSFTQFPFTAADETNLEAAYQQVRADGGILLLTLEPRKGLAAVTQAVTDKLAGTLDRFNKAGVPVIVRFAHEMNGSWYEWGQQPAEYKAAFRRVAGSVHRLAPGSATMWAPNYGGGYPFTGGAHQAVAGTGAYTALDTDRNGEVTGADDPYAPYYPGDDAVDWVGMSLYHWGNTHPWGANVVPEPGKFLQQLTGPTTAPAATTSPSPTSTPSTARNTTSRSRSRKPPPSASPATRAPRNWPSNRPGGGNCSTHGSRRITPN